VLTYLLKTGAYQILFYQHRIFVTFEFIFNISSMSKKKIVVKLLLVFLPFFGIAQQNTIITYDSYNDTLLVLGEIELNKSKLLIEREDFLSTDTLYTNQNGLEVEAFNLQAIALGNNILLNSDGALITSAMKNAVKNEQYNYKFIYIKDVVLRTSAGKIVKPSINSVKIIFSN
jgi:hypothetical protein